MSYTILHFQDGGSSLFIACQNNYGEIVDPHYIYLGVFFFISSWNWQKILYLLYTVHWSFPSWIWARNW